mgnify:CR=1 FL=1
MSFILNRPLVVVLHGINSLLVVNLMHLGKFPTPFTGYINEGRTGGGVSDTVHEPKK